MDSDFAFTLFNRAISTASLESIDTAEASPVFICGAPRSGTTFLYQNLVFHGRVGYFSNLSARFAENPILGALYSEAIGIEPTFTGKSEFGRTTHMTEPHEFGAGWSNILAITGLQQPHEDIELSKGTLDTIKSITKVFGRPTVFKSFAYLWFIEKLANQLPHSKWIFIDRNIEANTNSLHKLYRERGTSNSWESAVLQCTIEKYSDLSGLEKCQKQIEDLNSFILREFSKIPAERKFCTNLEQLVENPKEICKEIFSKFDIELVSRGENYELPSCV